MFLDHANLMFVSLGAMMLCIASAIVGTFTFLSKKALVGDAVAHAILPGVCLAFMLSGSKDPFWIILGAFGSGWIALLTIDWITNTSKIKEDTAIGLILSVFFGFGIMLLVSIQHSGNANQSGLQSFLFGSAASLVGKDLIVFSTLAVGLILTAYLLFKEFKILTFDKQYAITIGMPVKTIEFILSTLTVLAIVVGIQAIGVVLMAAMLITPATAARFWTDRLQIMLILAGVFAAISGLSGTLISYAASGMPTGPWIVIVISVIAISSFFVAPNKGILSKWWRQNKNRRQMMEENILKTVYLIEEKDQQTTGHKMEDFLEWRPWKSATLKNGLRRLVTNGYLKSHNNTWTLTKEGRNRGQRVVRLHRLWELYLTEYLRIAPDHVHEDAETIEHVITPELEKNIMEKLGYPDLDPHKSQIPYRQ